MKFKIKQKSYEIPDEKQILLLLQSMIKECDLRENRLYLKSYDIFIECVVPTSNSKYINGIFSMQVIYMIKQENWNEDVIESVTGVGKTKKQAMEQAVSSFYNCVLECILKSINGKSRKTIDITLTEKNHKFYIYSGQIVSNKTPKPEDKTLYDLVSESMHGYLGTKKVYWLKLFVSRYQDRVICEARLNGIVYTGLTKILEEYGNGIGYQESYYTKKQFIVFLQDEATYEECPFTKKNIMQYVGKTMPLFENYNGEKGYEAIYDKIFKMTKNKNLSIELYSFIPEIYCQKVLRVKEDDTLVAMTDAENESNVKKYELHKSQVRSYGYIEEAVTDYLGKANVKKEQMLNAISCSAKYNTIQQALAEGAKFEDLYMIGIAYSVDDDYKIW